MNGDRFKTNTNYFESTVPENETPFKLEYSGPEEQVADYPNSSYGESELSDFKNYVISGQLYAAVNAAFLAGTADENSITDMIFYARHPERDKKERLKSHETELIKEWKEIRDKVRSILAELKKSKASTSIPGGLPVDKPVDFAPEPMKLPVDKPVDFAPEPAGEVYWPVVSTDKNWNVVSYRFGPNRGDVVRGRNTEREFYASRYDKKIGHRFHAAIDLYANAGDRVISCEIGTVLYTITNFLGDTSAIYIQHPNIIAVYGEIKNKSWETYHLKVGDPVKPGQIIGEVGITPGGTSMLHFETWDLNLKNAKYPLSGSFRSWKKDGNPPQYVLNPTKYLLYIKNHGKRKRSEDLEFETFESPQDNFLSSSESLVDNESILSTIGGYLTSAQLYAAVNAAFLAGTTDENSITDMIFYARHPERDKKERLKSHETELIKEWKEIRDKVRSILAELKKSKASTPSKSNIPYNLPRVLAGPIVRRSTTDSIWFWIAVSEEVADVSGRIVQYDSQGQVLSEISVVTTSITKFRLGENIWVALFKIVPTDGKLFPPDTILGYDLKLLTSNPYLLSDLKLELNYPPYPLPTIIIGKSNTNIVHGSCRRPGSGYSDYPDSEKDAFGAFDEWMRRKASSVNERPASLILTGDQIYADDVALPIFDAIQKISKDIFGYSEQMECYNEYKYASTLSKFPIQVIKSFSLWSTFTQTQNDKVTFIDSDKFLSKPDPNIKDSWSHRRILTHRLTSPFGFTTDDGEAHLLSFPEYASMYLIVWSPQLWVKYCVEDKEIQKLISDNYTTLNKYQDYVKACQRVMANCATYMIFDDHDVTDDWNLDQVWESTTKNNKFSRQVISNALIAYYIFQGCGNDPDMFGSELVLPVINHLNTLMTNKGKPDANAPALYQTMLSKYWSFVAATNPKALCVDTRTLREFPHVDLQEPWKMRGSDWANLTSSKLAFLSKTADFANKLFNFTDYNISQIYDALEHPRRRAQEKSAILTGKKHWNSLKDLMEKYRFAKGDVLLMVLATPFIGHPFHIAAQEAKFDYPSQRYAGDYELYDNNPSQRAELIDWLRKTLGPSAVVILSGDVHYGSVIYGGYVHANSEVEMNLGRYDWRIPVIQVTSSPIKNGQREMLWIASQPEVSTAAELKAPEARVRHSTSLGGFLIAGFKTADLSGDLGNIKARSNIYRGSLRRDTYIPNNHMCVVTMPKAPDNVIRSLFIGINDDSLATQETSKNVFSTDEFMGVVKEYLHPSLITSAKKLLGQW